MKKILMVVWVVVIAGLVVYMFSARNSPLRNYINLRAIEKNSALAAERKQDIFSPAVLDSLLVSNELILLSVGSGKCGACDHLIMSPVPGEFSLPHYFLDRELHRRNRLVSQALFNTSSPESYVLDRDMNIVGVVRGNAGFRESLEDIVNQKRGDYTGQSDFTRQEDILPTLSSGLRGLVAYLKKDWGSVREHAFASMSKGEYPFNNYLLYHYHKNGGVADSASHYRTRTIDAMVNGRDVYVYESILRELDPDNEKLAILQHNH